MLPSHSRPLLRATVAPSPPRARISALSFRSPSAFRPFRPFRPFRQERHLATRRAPCVPAMQNKAAFLESLKGDLVVRDAEIGQPGEGEVLIKTHAAGIQRSDAKCKKEVNDKMEYPCILGSAVAGVVTALGPGVSKVKVGDRVAAISKVFIGKKPKYGGLQRYTVVDQQSTFEIGDVDFAKAVTLVSSSPPGALFSPAFLNMPFPTIPASPLPSQEQGKKILIWGGSSAMGSLAISYAKAAGYTVISTSSPHNFDLLRTLGADHVFDRNDAATVDKIRDLFPIHYWFDPIAQSSSLKAILAILAPEGEPVTKANILIFNPILPEFSELPDGITMQFMLFLNNKPENAGWRDWALSKDGFMEKGIKTGVIKAVPPEVIGGLEKVAEGIDRVYVGVSGRKIVVDPWA